MKSFDNFKEWMRENHRGVNLLPWQSSFARAHLDEDVPMDELLVHVPMAAGRSFLMQVLKEFKQA